MRTGHWYLSPNSLEGKVATMFLYRWNGRKYEFVRYMDGQIADAMNWICRFERDNASPQS